MRVSTKESWRELIHCKWIKNVSIYVGNEKGLRTDQ